MRQDEPGSQGASLQNKRIVLSLHTSRFDLSCIMVSLQMKEQGIRFEIDEEEDEDWDDILEDLDDPWMREPAPGEPSPSSSFNNSKERRGCSTQFIH